MAQKTENSGHLIFCGEGGTAGRDRTLDTFDMRQPTRAARSAASILCAGRRVLSRYVLL